MPIVKNEADVKKQSQFLKYESGNAGNLLILKSHLYKIEQHYIQAVRRSVICKGDKCSYCQKGYRSRSEFNYMVSLNDQVGFMDIKPSVFFAIQEISHAQKRDIRKMSWTVIKTGEGLNTNYTTSKDDNLEKGMTEKELNENTDKLSQVMTKHEEQLIKNYSLYENQTKPAPKKTEKEEPPMPEEEI